VYQTQFLSQQLQTRRRRKDLKLPHTFYADKACIEAISHLNTTTNINYMLTKDSNLKYSDITETRQSGHPQTSPAR
jgi:hypothetical protein